MEEDRQQVEKLTEALRHSTEALWAKIRALLKEKGVDPEKTIVACAYPEDYQYEFGIIICEDRKIFQYGFDTLRRSIQKGYFKEWNDITETYPNSQHRKIIEIALRCRDEQH